MFSVGAWTMVSGLRALGRLRGRKPPNPNPPTGVFFLSGFCLDPGRESKGS